MIFDGHAYCFPDVRGDLGFSSPEAQRIHVQKGMASHHIQPWRVSDRSLGRTSDLLDAEKWPDDAAALDVNFRPTKHGRYEWTIDGVDYVKQYFPPAITDMAYPADKLIAEMDYANVSGALLHRNPYLGMGNSFILDCVRQYPDRLYGLAHVPEWQVADDPDGSAAEIESALNKGLSGTQFLISEINLRGKDPDWAGDRYAPFWERVVSLGKPVFFSLNVNQPNRKPTLDHYMSELKRLGLWMERFSGVDVVLTHGFPAASFAKGDLITLPDEVWEPFENPRLYLQFLFAIGLGWKWDFPLPQARPVVEDAMKRIGAGRLMWGTDMPIVMRHMTYQQNIDIIAKYCDFLSGEEQRLFMGGTTMRLLGLETT